MTTRGLQLAMWRKLGDKAVARLAEVGLPADHPARKQLLNKRSETADVERGPGRPVLDDKRRKLLDAALRTFAERGYHGTSVPDVAKAAKVATGSVYNYFADKNDLVNQVYRDAKRQLKAALLDGLAEPDLAEPTAGEQWFAEVWRRLSSFAIAEPEAFRFLEMQDHVEYLDDESRALELSVLGPLFMAGQKLRNQAGGPSIDISIALLWGAFVGVVKAGRLGYLKVDDKKLAEAGLAAWRLIAPSTSRTSSSNRRKKGN